MGGWREQSQVVETLLVASVLALLYLLSWEEKWPFHKAVCLLGPKGILLVLQGTLR